MLLFVAYLGLGREKQILYTRPSIDFCKWNWILRCATLFHDQGVLAVKTFQWSYGSSLHFLGRFELDMRPIDHHYIGAPARLSKEQRVWPYKPHFAPGQPYGHRNGRGHHFGHYFTGDLHLGLKFNRLVPRDRFDAGKVIFELPAGDAQRPFCNIPGANSRGPEQRAGIGSPRRIRREWPRQYTGGTGAHWQ